jgi:hypothetical protein
VRIAGAPLPRDCESVERNEVAVALDLAAELLGDLLKLLREDLLERLSVLDQHASFSVRVGCRHPLAMIGT